MTKYLYEIDMFATVSVEADTVAEAEEIIEGMKTRYSSQDGSLKYDVLTAESKLVTVDEEAV